MLIRSLLLELLSLLIFCWLFLQENIGETITWYRVLDQRSNGKGIIYHIRAKKEQWNKGFWEFRWDSNRSSWVYLANFRNFCQRKGILCHRLIWRSPSQFFGVILFPHIYYIFYYIMYKNCSLRSNIWTFSLSITIRKLCEAPYNKTLDWSKWYIFWSDERAVAKNHAESNYKLTKEGFLAKVCELKMPSFSVSFVLCAAA